MNVPLAKQRSERERPFYRRLAIGLKLFAGIYLGILGFMMYSETSLVFPGATTDRGDWNHPGIDLEEVEIDVPDGTTISGYFFKQPTAERTLLYCHGNEENIAMLAHEADHMRSELNASVLLFDYRGFGKSEGKPNESGVLADAEAASAWLAKKTGVPEEDFILFGRSLGGGVAVHLACQHDAKAVILDRTFSSAVDVAASRYWWLPVRFVMRNQFLSLARIHHFDGPLLQFHGDIDEVIPFWSAERLFAHSPSNVKEFRPIKGLTHMVPMPLAFIEEMKVWLAQTTAVDIAN
jgi:uncharacterized protein